jgi:hypothetical protein
LYAEAVRYILLFGRKSKRKFRLNCVFRWSGEVFIVRHTSKRFVPSLMHLFCALLLCVIPASAATRWPAQRARNWYAAQPWLVGCNYIPSTAINQLEMWQSDTFDLATIDRELGWAKQLGFNSVRIFLHHLLWEQDHEGFVRRIDQFLATADRHGIRVVFVLLDGCWDPYPKLGRQPDPKPYVHNSGWVQSPGVEILKNPTRHRELKDYVQGMVSHYGNDKRVVVWDLYNEPDESNDVSYAAEEPPHVPQLALPLLKQVFAWAREMNPSQPLTAAVCDNPAHANARLVIEQYLYGESDIISFHSYSPIEGIRDKVQHLKRYGRPLLCTEYMARPLKSTFDPVMGYLKEQRVGAYNWGFVSGKTQTIYPWDSWAKRYTAEPSMWFHDILRKDGSPFDPKEVEYIERLTEKEK